MKLNLKLVVSVLTAIMQEWNQIWNELSTDESKAIGLKSMVQLVLQLVLPVVDWSINVPLQFWFCRNPGLALPLIALQYHEVKIKFTWGNCKWW